MLKDLFSNRLLIAVLAFFVLCVVGGTLYISHVEKQGVEELATDEDRVKQVTEKQQPQPTAKAPVGGDTSQGGHFHEDGTWHGNPHDELISDERFESDAEFKARMEKYNAEMAAAKTAREKNEALMRHMEASPYFDLYYQNVYNFYKAHPDYDHANHETNSLELKKKYADAVYADVAKVRADNAARKVEYEQNRYKGIDKNPWIPPQGGNR